MLLEGMHLPLTTPFHADGRLNTRKLEDNLARYSKTPAAGFVVLGRNGQPWLLSDVETREVLRAAADAAAREKVLIAGAPRDSVAGTLDLIEIAAVHGYDAALVRTPQARSGVAATDWRETLTYFQTVADRSPLPLVLVSGASPAAALDDAMAIELAGHPGVIGLLEEGLDMDHDAERIQRLLLGTKPVRREVLVTMVFQAATGRMLAQVESNSAQFVSAGELSGGGSVVSATPAKPVLKTRTKTVGFQILAGRTAGVLDALRAGAAGAVPPLAASVPQACYEVLAAWKDGDPALAAEKQERLLALAQRVEQELGVAGIKYGCDLTGYFGGRPRLPGLPLKGVEREEIDALMQGLRN